MVNLASAHAQVSAAAVVAIQMAAPLMVVGASEVPFGNTVLFLAGSIAKHVAAVQGNDELLRKAERQAEAVTQLVQKLEHAEFKENDPAFANVIEALVSLEGLARSWSVKTPRNKCLSFSLRNGSSTALAFEKEFVACIALLDKACETLVLAVAVESFTGIQALSNDLAKTAAARCAEFATTSESLALQEQSLEELQGSVAALKEGSLAAGARVETLLEELMRGLKVSVATAVRQGVAGAAAGDAAHAAASIGARKAAEELGADAQALELHLLNSVPALLAAIASENEASRAAVAASQAEIEAVVERGRVGIQAKLDEVLFQLRDCSARLPTDGLEPSLVAFLMREGHSHLGGFFQRCQVRSLSTLALVPEADMFELGLTPLQAARVAAVMDIKHPSCPLRLNCGNGLEGTTGAIITSSSPPLPPRRLKPVLDFGNLSALLKEVLENPGKEVGLRQSLDVVLELVEADAKQALKLSGLSTVMVLGVTGAGKSTLINYLIGVPLKPVLNAGLETFVVDNELGVASIKNGAVSATLLPGVHATDDGVLTDCPGLFDTRAPAVNVANGINVAACAESASAAKFVLSIELSSAKAARGNALKEVFLALAESLGGVNSLNSHAESVLVLVSKAPLDYDVKNARELLTEAAAVLNEDAHAVALKLFERAELYHPLDQGHKSWTKLSSLKDKIQGMPPIPRPGNIYRPSLSFADERLLRDITNTLVTAVTSDLNEQHFSACADSLAALERLNVVNLRIVHVLVANAMSQVRAHVERFFKEAQQCLLNDHFDDALQLAKQMRALATALHRSVPTSGSALAADLARSLSLRVGDLEKLVEHRRLEEQRFAQAQREQKAQSAQTKLLQAKLAKLELVNRGLASELESVQNELVQAQEAAINKARHLEATFLEKIKALEERAARGEQKEESSSEAVVLRDEMNRALKALQEEATAHEEAIKRAIEDQMKIAQSKAAEEAVLRRNLESAEAAQWRQSLEERQAAAMAAAVEAAERKAADAADQAQKAAANAQDEEWLKSAVEQSASEKTEDQESPSAVRAEGEARVRDLIVRHNANIEALSAAAEAQASSREAQLAQTIQTLEVSLANAKEDFDPDAAVRIQTEIVEAKSTAFSANITAHQELSAAIANAIDTHSATIDNTTILYKTRATKVEELVAAQAVLEAAESEQIKKYKADRGVLEAGMQARAAALEAAAEKKVVEGRQAMSIDDFSKAKALKDEADQLKREALEAADGKDDAGIRERKQRAAEALPLRNAVADAINEVKRCEEEFSFLPKTSDAFKELQPFFKKRLATRYQVLKLWARGDFLAAYKQMEVLMKLPWSMRAATLSYKSDQEAQVATTATAAVQFESVYPAAVQLELKSSAQICRACGVKFNASRISMLAVVKYSCKSCGHVICKSCSPTKAHVSSYSTPKRVCNPCAELKSRKLRELAAIANEAEERYAEAKTAAQSAVIDDAESAPELNACSAALFLGEAINEAMEKGEQELAAELRLKKFNEVGEASFVQAIRAAVNPTKELLDAASNGNEGLIKLCIINGAEVDDYSDSGRGFTPLIKASMNGHAASVKLLLEAGAKTDTKNKNASTALMAASINGHTATLELLLEAGADKEAKNKNGCTALFYASQNGHASSARLLLEAGADKMISTKV